MKMKGDLPKRKRLRLRNFDYSTPGAYFITICTDNRKCTLSRIVGAIHESPAIMLTGYGKIVESIINSIPDHLKSRIVKYVIMPNHVHLVVQIVGDEELRAIRESPLRSRSVISKAIGYIKMNSSKKVRAEYGDVTLWQRGFHDHIIRDREDYAKIVQYICHNPARWQYDCLFVENTEEKI